MTRSEVAVQLVGRERSLEDTTTALLDPNGFGAVLVGEAGVGKTALAQVALDQLDWTAPVLPVTGGSALRRIAFGAFAPYLHSLPLTDVDSPVAVLRAVMDHLAAQRTDRAQLHPPLLVVDNADDLDDSSSALLAQLISARRAKVLVIVRDLQAAPAEFQHLSTDNLLTRIDLAPLDVDEVAVLCAQLLGGRVLTSSTHTLAVATGGNPRLLRAVLECGEAEGYLEQHDDVWSLRPDRWVVTARVGDVVRAHLRSRSASELSLLELIALTEPITLEVLAQDDGFEEEVLERLRNARLVVVGHGPEHVVSLEPPLFGEVLRHRLPLARSVITRRRILDLLPGEAQSSESFLRTVSWRLECGESVDDRILLRAGSLANGLSDYTFSLRAARAVAAPDLRGHALIELARAHAGRGSLADAQDLAREALDLSRDLRVIADGMLLSFELGLRSGASSEDLHHVVERWKSVVADLDARPGAHRVGTDPAWARLGPVILECRVRLLEGRLDGLEEELRDLLSARSATAESRVGCLILLGELLGVLGRSAAGIVHSQEALDIIDAEGASLLVYRTFAVERHLFLLTISGLHAEAGTFLDAFLRENPRTVPHLAVWSDLIGGIVALRAARNREARDRLLLAAAALRQYGDSHVAALPIGMAAYACALAGETDWATALIDDFRRNAGGGSVPIRLRGEIFVTATAALIEGTGRARAELLDLAAAADRGQLKELAGTALRLVLLLGDSRALDPLLDLLPGLEESETSVLLNFVRAAAVKDTDAMVDAASAAGELGDIALEFAALTLAHRFIDEKGSTRQSRTIRRRLLTMAEQREGHVPPPLAAAPSSNTPRLTPTEQAIVDLVKEGYSNRDIADAKEVSVRTVEGHLYRIFAKFGVSRREDLRER